MADRIALAFAFDDTVERGPTGVNGHRRITIISPFRPRASSPHGAPRVIHAFIESVARSHAVTVVATVARPSAADAALEELLLRCRAGRPQEVPGGFPLLRPRPGHQGQGRAAPAMADLPVRAVLLAAADVVEQGGEREDAEIGLLLAPDPQGQPEDALGVVPVVAAPGAAEEGAGLLADPR